MTAELLIYGFLVEHNPSFITADHAAKLSRNMFPDSKIVKEYRSDCTKTENMINRAIAEKITSVLKEELLQTCWYGLATDGSSNKDDKFFPVSVRNVDKDSGLIMTSLLNIPSSNNGSGVQHGV